MFFLCLLQATSPITYNCHQCHKSFTRDCYLQMHLKFHRQYLCSICNAKLIGRTNLQNHYKTHSFQCYVCKRIFPSVESLNTHIAKHIVYERWVDPANVYLSNWSPEKSREILQNQPLVLVENLNVKNMNLKFSVSINTPHGNQLANVENDTKPLPMTCNIVPPSIEKVKLENGTEVNGEIPSAVDESEKLSSCPINIELKYSEQTDLQLICDESNKEQESPNSVSTSDGQLIQQPDTTSIYADDGEAVIDISSESDVDEMELFHCYFCNKMFRSLDALGRHVKTCSFCP